MGLVITILLDLAALFISYTLTQLLPIMHVNGMTWHWALLFTATFTLLTTVGFLCRLPRSGLHW
jgi:hypothetical protein